MMKRAFLLFLIGCMFYVPRGVAHVGSPDVFYEGMAGPYRLFVTVRTPPMIPGIAEIEVRALDGNVSDIRIVPLRAVGEGSENAPPSDRMIRSQADAQYFSGSLWLMESGAWQVRIDVFGTQGKAETAVPVPAAARRTLRMQKTTGIILAGLMLLLVTSMIAIFGAAARESSWIPAWRHPLHNGAVDALPWPSPPWRLLAFCSSEICGGIRRPASAPIS